MKSFEKYKEEAMEKLRIAKEEGKADKPAYEILDLINSKEDYFTTSSCSGRILLLKGGENKKESSFYMRWHREISVKELEEAIENYNGEEMLWYRVQPFIFHVIARDEEKAFRFVEYARKGGVKRIGVQRIKYAYLIELYGTESISIPLGMCECDLKNLVEISNKKMRKNKERMEKLMKELEKL